MKSHKASMSLCAVAAMTLGMLAVPARALSRQEPITAQQASRDVMTTNVRVHDGVISGTVVNRTGDTLRNVKLMIDHAWLWEHEFRPGEHSPSRTDFYIVPQAIPPHGSVAFEYHTTPPLPKRSDGHFETIVKVAAFTQAARQQALR
jgi:hypothetical protein